MFIHRKQASLAGKNKVVENRFCTRSKIFQISEHGQLEVLKLESRCTCATYKIIMQLGIPFRPLHQKTAIGCARFHIQSRERAKPNVGWHGILWPLAGIKI